MKTTTNSDNIVMSMQNKNKKKYSIKENNKKHTELKNGLRQSISSSLINKIFAFFSVLATLDEKKQTEPQKKEHLNICIKGETISKPSQSEEAETNTKGEIEIKHPQKRCNWLKNQFDLKLITNLMIALSATVIGGIIVFLTTIGITNVVLYYRCYSKPYITFESDYTQIFRLSDSVEKLEYSVGEKRWKAVGTQSIVFGGNHGKMMLRGQSKIGTNGASISFATDAQVVCTGDICTLIDYKKYDQADTKKASFHDLFNGCSQLVVAPELTPKELADSCYSFMFKGCTSLKTAPELLANELSVNCYSYMFADCISLKAAPLLPADSLVNECYSGMFYNCTSLEKAPALPATHLAKKCYSDMFYGCTSLKTVHVLPADSLVNECYSGMFYNCTSLEKAPALPATHLAKKCYSDMFYGCTSLEAVPELPSSILADECYCNMFYGCTSLKTAPDLPAHILANECYSSMFYGCTSLKTAPDLPATQLAKGCYDFMFFGCQSLNEISMSATEIDADYCSKSWLDYTFPVGTFYKNKDANWSNNDVVPLDWKVVLVDSLSLEQIKFLRLIRLCD